MKAIIISQPKAGTYLCVNLLSNFGLIKSGYHISYHYYKKYDLENLEFSRNNESQFRFIGGVDDVAPLIEDNTVSVTHAEPVPIFVSTLLPFKKIILSRDRDERIESWRRWKEMVPQVLYKHSDIISHDNILNWLIYENTFHLTFNDIIHLNKDKIDQLQVFLFDEIKVDSIEACMNAIVSPSLTKSYIR